MQRFVLGQEYQSCAVLTLFGDGNTLKQYKLVWNLQHDTCTVASLVVCSLCTSVAHVLENFQSIVYKLMALVTVDVNHHAYTASVVLVRGIIQSICHFVLRFN